MKKILTCLIIISLVSCKKDKPLHKDSKHKCGCPKLETNEPPVLEAKKPPIKY